MVKELLIRTLGQYLQILGEDMIPLPVAGTPRAGRLRGKALRKGADWRQPPPLFARSYLVPDGLSKRNVFLAESGSEYGYTCGLGRVPVSQFSQVSLCFLLTLSGTCVGCLTRYVG